MKPFLKVGATFSKIFKLTFTSHRFDSNQLGRLISSVLLFIFAICSLNASNSLSLASIVAQSICFIDRIFSPSFFVITSYCFFKSIIVLAIFSLFILMACFSVSLLLLSSPRLPPCTSSGCPESLLEPHAS